MCWAADESDEEPAASYIFDRDARDDQIRLYEDVRLDGPPLLAKSAGSLSEDDDEFRVLLRTSRTRIGRYL